MPDVAKEEEQRKHRVAVGKPAASASAEHPVRAKGFAVELEGLTQLSLTGVAFHQSRFSDGLTSQIATVERSGDPSLLKAVFRFSPAEGNVGADNTVFVHQHHGEGLKEVR